MKLSNLHNMRFLSLIALPAYIFLILIFFSCDPPSKVESTNSKTVDQNISNGDLNETFKNNESIVTKPTKTEEEIFSQKRQALIAEGWSEDEIQNGQLPACYNFKPKKGRYDNYLEVTVGGGTDVAIKIMDKETEKCVRYVFINSNSTHKIKKIPEGIYYLKIAYGKNWLSKVEDGRCNGKFIRNPLYEKGEDELNYYVRKDLNGYSIPSFSLQLDVISTNTSNSFNSANITEEYFNE
jgi:hypothetical protein